MKANRAPIRLNLPTSAQAWHITPIWSRVNGYLIRYLVDIGDRVKKGDLLAEIDTPETDQELAEAEAELVHSISERDIAKITKERWDRLWEKNKEAVSKQEVDQYDANLQSAEALVVANQKNVARLTYQQQFKFIYAPFDGVITQRNIDIGTLIYGNINGAPEELFQIAETHLIRFFVQVPQTYFKHIKKGLEAEIAIDEFPGRVFKGTVSRDAQALDPTARTLLTEIDIENPDGILYPGLFGELNFLLTPDTPNFIVPTTALIIRSGLPHIAVVDSLDIAHLRPVQIGLDYGKQMDITWGLQENDRIIKNPTPRIIEGQKVQIILETAVGPS